MDKNIIILGKDFYRYRFNCTKCSEEISLRTTKNNVKDGHVGEFACPFCGEAYSADIEMYSLYPHVCLYPHVWLKNSVGEVLDLIMEGHELPREQVERITEILSELGPAVIDSGVLHVNEIPRMKSCIESFGKRRDRFALDLVKSDFGEIENLKYRDKSINARIKELLIACRMPDMDDSTVEVYVEIGNINPFRYEFNCAKCNNKIDLRTGSGRYGMLGPFKCPFCEEKYNSIIEDCSPCPRVSVFAQNGKQAELVQTKYLMTENEISQVKEIMDRLILVMNREIISDALSNDLRNIENVYNIYRKYHDKYFLSSIMRCITNAKERDYAGNEINKLMDEFICLYEKIINKSNN